MSDVNTLQTPSGFTRHLPLIIGGVALAGLGLAAGLVLRSPSASPEVAPMTTLSNSVQTPAPAPIAAPAATPAPVHAATAKPAPRHETSSTTAGTQGAAPAAQPAPQPVAICKTCGVVESAHAVEEKGQGTGLGAVAGGVLGGVVGHQMGGGNGKTAMTVLGAVGGGLAGNEVEKRGRSTTSYSVGVRMEDGSLRTLNQATAPAIGTRVTVDEQGMRAR